MSKTKTKTSKSTKRGPNLKPHLYSKSLEYAIVNLSRSAVAAERKALVWFLANCFDEGYTETEIAAAYAELMQSDRHRTLGLRFFKKYLQDYVEERSRGTTRETAAW